MSCSVRDCRCEQRQHCCFWDLRVINLGCCEPCQSMIFAVNVDPSDMRFSSFVKFYGLLTSPSAGLEQNGYILQRVLDYFLKLMQHCTVQWRLLCPFCRATEVSQRADFNSELRVKPVLHNSARAAQRVGIPFASKHNRCGDLWIASGW